MRPLRVVVRRILSKHAPGDAVYLTFSQLLGWMVLVAEARDMLGAIQHNDEAAKGSVSVADALVAYFAILWCFERIYAGERYLRSHSKRLQRDISKSTPACALCMIRYIGTSTSGTTPSVSFAKN